MTEIVCPVCLSGGMYREFEPEADYGEILEEYVTVTATCKMCDTESRFIYFFCEEEECDEV